MLRCWPGVFRGHPLNTDTHDDKLYKLLSNKCGTSPQWTVFREHESGVDIKLKPSITIPCLGLYDIDPYWFQLGDITWALYSLKLAIQLALRLNLLDHFLTLGSSLVPFDRDFLWNLGWHPPRTRWLCGYKICPRRSRASTVPLHRCPAWAAQIGSQKNRPRISAASPACFTSRKMSRNMVPFGTKPYQPGILPCFFLPRKSWNCEDHEDLDEAFNNPLEDAINCWDSILSAQVPRQSPPMAMRRYLGLFFGCWNVSLEGRLPLETGTI